jgi:N-formylglutamate amidohydrolase
VCTAVWLLLPGLLIAGVPLRSAGADGWVSRVSGNLPLIITAPHGGNGTVAGCPERTAVGPRFVNRPDAATAQLAQQIADALAEQTGKQPYLVIARFHRRYIDANRPPEEAYADSACAGAYATYHNAIQQFIDDARKTHTQVLLIDVHGQSAYRSSILRGTRHGHTVTGVLARHGPAAITGTDSIFGRLAHMGYDVMPANELPPTGRVEPRGYTGGHTVALYGGGKADRVDAMQMEFGIDLRQSGIIEQTAKDAATAIAAFYRRYLTTGNSR